MTYKRIFTIVLDSLGVGELKDAYLYGDEHCDTLGHICACTPDIKLPNMRKLGLGNLYHIENLEPVKQPLGYYTKLGEVSAGKDTMSGHLEMMGLPVTKPFKTFTEHGFPESLIKELSEKCGYGILGNKAASGTEILKELGEEHMKTKKMIVYTSADSVLQIACHEEIFGLDELYRCCEIAREITLKDEYKVGRVIARPFITDHDGNFIRTSNRHDYALKPSDKTILNYLEDEGYATIGVGKIHDIFDGEGISETYKSKSNEDGMNITISLTEKDFTGLCYVNLVDFDALWGHRRNLEGYAKELERFDHQLGELMKKLNDDDLLILCADHGNDPTHTGSDHTREHVPFILYSPSFKGSGLLPYGNTFAIIGNTIAENFQVKQSALGSSYLKYIK